MLRHLCSNVSWSLHHACMLVLASTSLSGVGMHEYSCQSQNCFVIVSPFCWMRLMLPLKLTLPFSVKLCKFNLLAFCFPLVYKVPPFQNVNRLFFARLLYYRYYRLRNQNQQVLYPMLIHPCYTSNSYQDIIDTQQLQRTCMSRGTKAITIKTGQLGTFEDIFR